MTKKILPKFLIFLTVIFLFFFSSGLKCIREREVINNTPIGISPSATKTPTISVAPIKNITINPITDYSPAGQAALDLSKSFIVLYTNYKEGDFSNWELLSGKITLNFQKEITEWIALKKKESKGKPVKYIYYSGAPQKTELMKINDFKAETRVMVDQEEVRGAILARTNTTGPTSVWVDENGQEAPYEQIQRVFYTKTFYLFLTKEGASWKVDSVTVNN